MKKTFKTTVALTAAALATSGTTVFAEESNVPEVQAIGIETASRTVSQETELAEATKASQKTQEEVIEHGKVVAKAREDAVQADHDLNDAKLVHAQATESAHEATPEAILAEEEKLALKKSQVAEAEANLEAAKKARESAKEANERQEKSLKAVKRDTGKAKLVVTEVEEAVKRAQEALDGTNASVILEEADNAQKSLEAAQTLVMQAQKSLEEAKRFDTARKALISDTKRELEQVQKGLDTAKVDQKQAELAVSRAQGSLSEAQSALTRAQNELAGVNTITLSQEYVQALKAYAANAYPKEVKEKLQAMNAELLAKNTFRVNPNDATVSLDPDNLSQDIREELTRFWVDLNNQVRRQMGTLEVIGNRSVIAFAKGVADGYTLDNFDFATTLLEGHDRSAIQAAAMVNGLDGTTVSYENKHSVGTKYEPITRLTLSQLKEYLYKSMLSFLFNGDEYFHAMSIAGAPGYGVTTRYIGIDFSNYADIFNIHVLGVGYSHVKNRSLFDTTDNLTPAVKRESLEQAVYMATSEVSRTTNMNKAAQDRLDTVNNTIRGFQLSVANLDQKLSQLSASAEKTAEAQTALETLTLSLTQARSANAAAQQAKELVLATQSNKQAALQEAKETLISKKSTYQTLQEEVDAQEAAFNETKKALAVAEAAVADRVDDLKYRLEEVKTLEDRLNRLKAAPHLLNQATAALQKAQEEADKAHQILEGALTKQTELELVAAALEEKRNRLLVSYEEYLVARQTESRLQELSQEVAKSAIKTASVYRSNPLSQLTYTGSVYGGSQLPKTGEQSQNSLLVVGITLLLSAFGLYRRKE